MDATIIIPTYNRSDALVQTLTALAHLDYPADRWEAVVVDDGSTDDTAWVIPEWTRTSTRPMRYLRLGNAGPAAARNRGAEAARGRTLLFIDNDIIVKPDFLSLHLQAQAAHPGCWIMGRIAHPPEVRRSAFGRYRDARFEASYLGQSSDRIAETEGMSAANLSLPAEDFHRLGGFDEHFTIASGEDWDLACRARRAGIRILYHPGIVVLHNDWAVALDKFCERQRLYSVSDVLLWRKYGESSPRAGLVLDNSPVNWRRDSYGLAVKKVLKYLLALGGPRRMVRLVCQVAESLAPDSRWSHRAYDAAVALAIFRGVREGLERYLSTSSPVDRQGGSLC